MGDSDCPLEMAVPRGRCPSPPRTWTPGSDGSVSSWPVAGRSTFRRWEGLRGDGNSGLTPGNRRPSFVLSTVPSRRRPMRVALLLVFVVATLIPCAAWPQGNPHRPEFRVNTYTTNDQ